MYQKGKNQEIELVVFREISHQKYLQCIFSGISLLLLEPSHEASSHEALVGEDIQEMLKDNNSH